MGKELQDLTEKNLSGANLIRASLSGADLRGMNLHMAQLTRAKLSEANLAGAELGGADLRKADLREANLGESILYKANLEEADLTGARLRNADLRGANLQGADLTDADFGTADLSAADLRGANLRGAKLMGTRLVASNFGEADLTGCQICGAFMWNAKLQDARQLDIVVTVPGEPAVTVDGLEHAQFIRLLLHHKNLCNMLDPSASRFALIVGHFASGRKNILNRMRNILRRSNYIPISLDVEKSAGRDIGDSLSALAQIAMYVVADASSTGSITHELESIVSGPRRIPVITYPEDLYWALQEDVNISGGPKRMN